MKKIFKNLTKKEILMMIVCFVFILTQVYLDLMIPDYMSNITKIIQTSNNNINDILIEGVKMLSCALGSFISAVIVGYFATKTSTSFSKNIRGKLFKHIMNFSEEEVKLFSSSSLITRCTNDITQIERFLVISLQLLVKAPVMAIWAITKISNKNSTWSLLTLFFVIFIVIFISIMMKIVLPKFKKIQTLNDNLNRVIMENITGIRVVRAYNAEEYQENKFETANKELKDNNTFVERTMSLLMPSISTLMSLLSVSIYYVGAILINNNANIMLRFSLFSDMIIFSNYAMQVIMSFLMMAMIFIIYPRTVVSIKRVNEVLDVESKIINGNSKHPKNTKKIIEFKNVSFKYPDAEEAILNNINLTIYENETVAFIGSTGSGKSTIINLIPRFYDVTEGEILLYGKNIKNYNLKYLNSLIGYISQKAILFKGTIKSNILYGTNKKIKDEQIYQSLKIAQGYDFVKNLPLQLENEVAQNGTNLSGGQKQRLSIARALVREPKILILDDCFSALDYKTDLNLRKSIKKNVKNCTTLIVAQRISTIKDADKIIVLNDGLIVGIGTHNELINNCEVYNEIALSQLSKEELNNA